MRTLLRIDEMAESVIVWIGRVASWLSIALIIIIVFDVITRRFLVLGSTKLQDLEWHIHAVLFLFCLGFAYLKDAHVRIELVSERLPRRMRLWIELIGCLLFLIPYTFVIIYYGIDWWHRSFMQNEMAESATGLPYRWIIKMALPIGFGILLVSAVGMAFRKTVQLFAPPELRALVDAREKQETVRLDQVDITEFGSVEVDENN